jgi:MFS family permease
MRLERANAAVQSTLNIAVLAGPVVAGLLVVALGAGSVLWIDAATFAVSASVIALAVPLDAVPRRPDTPRETDFRRELRAGVAFVWSDRPLRRLLAASAVTIAIISALLTIVAPVYAGRVFGSPIHLGLLAAGFGGGSLLGSVAFGAVGHRLPRWPTFVAGTALVGLPLWVLAGMPPLLVMVALLGVVGLAFGALLPVMDTILQERAPEELRGRVFGIRVAVVNGIKPLGVLVVGIALEQWGLRATLLVAAAVSLLTSVTLLGVATGHAVEAPAPEREPARA